MKQLLLMAGIALLCFGECENDQLCAQTLNPQNKQVDTLYWMFRIYEDNYKYRQLYFIYRPELQFIATEAVLQGGMFTHNPNLIGNSAPAKPQQEPPASPQPHPPINNIVFASNFGAVASIGDISISFNQNSSTAMMKGLYSHEVGNISLYFGW